MWHDPTNPSQWAQRDVRDAPRLLSFDYARLMNLLVTFAYTGEHTYTSIARLCGFVDAPDDSPYAAVRYRHRSWKRLFQHLKADGLLDSVCRFGNLNRIGIPHRKEDLWALTEAGHRLIESLEQYPRIPRKRSPTAMHNHDTVTTHFLTWFIERSRMLPSTLMLSGLFVNFEYRLDPPKLSPRSDVLIIARFGGTLVRPDLIPWVKSLAADDDHLTMRFVLENDRATESRAVITQKARDYRATCTPDWRDLYGAFPIPIWIVPDYKRLMDVNACWRQGWSEGTWLITTDELLKNDIWMEYHAGSFAQRNGFFRTDLMRNAMKGAML